MRQRVKESVNAVNNEIIISLLEPIINAYEQKLHEEEEIDFNDMINMAIKYIENNEYVNPYRYVIVDEYQDMSKSRFKLLEAMRKSREYKLFCVGDDWQSIYRFAGSDIGFILNFNKYWGATEISRIETTYRFSEQLIEISGTFIMKNPMQIKKCIKGRTDTIEFPLEEINGYSENNVINFVLQRLDLLPINSSVFFIGRYTFDNNLIKNKECLECKYNKESGVIKVIYNRRPDLNMSFITAHKSKGLQADYVFIINNKKSKMGFPSKIQDAPILDVLLINSDRYPYAEERRLFYVALTRAKKKVFLVTVKDQESVFAMELKKRYAKKLKQRTSRCPLCGGDLIKKDGKYGVFYGCSNFKSNGCRYKKDI